METRRERFVRLAEARTNKILSMINLLGNCSNISAYEYTNKDVEKIFNTIEFELREARKRFNKQDSKKSVVFSLNEEE